MKVFRISVFAFMLTAAAVLAAGNASITVDIQEPLRPCDLRTVQGTTKGWDFYCLDDGADFLVTGYTGRLYYAESWSGAAWSVSVDSSSATSNVVTIAPSKLQVATNGEFVCQVVLDDGDDLIELARGILTIDSGITSSGVLATAASDYLLRAGTYPMTGNLDHGGQNSTNIAQIRFSGAAGTWINQSGLWRDGLLHIDFDDHDLFGEWRIRSGLTSPTGRFDRVELTSGNLDMGGGSVTNIATNSLVFTDGEDITSAKVGQWELAYGWGDHAESGYLSAEVDPFAILPGGERSMTNNLTMDRSSNAFAALSFQIKFRAGNGFAGETVTNGLGYNGESDFLFRAGPFGTPYRLLDEETANPSLWDWAYSWGDHSVAGYLGTGTWAVADSTTNYLPRTGGTMSGDLDMGGRSVTNVTSGTLSTTSTNLTITQNLAGVLIIANPAAESSDYYLPPLSALLIGASYRMENVTTNVLRVWPATGNYLEEYGPGTNACIYSGAMDVNGLPYAAIEFIGITTNVWAVWPKRHTWTYSTWPEAE